jgi:glutathione synthase/RimK-type ligase-like ATP-grasp enzyme
MSKTKVRIPPVRTSGFMEDNTVHVSDRLTRKWGIAPYESVNLRFGAYKGNVKVVPVKKPGYVRLSEGLAARMGLTGGASLRASYRSSSKTLSVGPLIGVIMSRVYPNQPDRPFGNTTAFCRELADASKMQGAFVYFFTPDGIGASDGTIQGWTFANNSWRQGVFPAPDVLHNRLTARRLENQANVQKLFKESKARYGTQVFNEKYLDKTEVFTALQQQPSLQRFLPESRAFTGYDTLKSMASKYRTVFLKPVRGSLGKGIVRVSKTEAGAYACHFSELSGTRRVVYPALAKVYAVMSQRMKKQKFQIQQGLQIATVDGRPVDFRALVQKDLSGEWSITSIVGRIAGANHFVSNLAKGGTITPAKPAIARSNVPASRRARVLAQLRKASLDIAKGIESTIDAHFGELGVDLAVDSSGRTWLLEVNSKPSKNDNTQLTEGKIRPSVKMIVQYARHLSKL